MRLFFSWQSDIPANKKLLRKLLQNICDELDIEYTDDTRDETGGGHVVDALLRKITNSHIFVGDITIVGKADNGDAVINSNVAYELGFAEAALSRSTLLLVMNEEYGTYEDMPFDLGKRIITRYRTRQDVLDDNSRKTLQSDLRRKIKALVGSSPAGITAAIPLNKAEKTLLYWAHHRGMGHITDFYTYSANGGNTYLAAGHPSAGRHGRVLLHRDNDHKTKARLYNALETLAAKGLLIQADTTHWVLSEEGELAATVISEPEAYPPLQVPD